MARRVEGGVCLQREGLRCMPVRGVSALLWFNENGHLDKGGTIEHGGVPQWQRNDATMAMNSSERQSGW
jgi:hypothetical protein